MIRLRLNALLLERNMTAYQLWKASGLAKNTAYAMARSAPRNQLDLPTLERAMQAIAAQSGSTTSCFSICRATTSIDEV